MCILFFVGLSKSISQNMQVKKVHRSMLKEDISKKIAEEQEKKKIQDLKFPPRYKPKVALTPGSPVWFKNNVQPIEQKAPDLGIDNITRTQGGVTPEVKSKNKVEPLTPANNPSPKVLDSQKKIQVSVENEIKKENKINEMKKAAAVKNISELADQDKQKKAAENSKGENSSKQKNDSEKAFLKDELLNNKQDKDLVMTKQKTTIPVNANAVTSQAQTKSPISPEKNDRGKFSLRDLQKGFSHHLRKGNNSIISRKSTITGDPDIDDLKLISYHKYIMQAITSGIKSIGEKDTKRLYPDAYVICYRLTIERDGTVSQYRLIDRSQHEELNKHAIEIIKNMGSIPPVPSYLHAPHIFTGHIRYFDYEIEFFN
jgi:hypothetical protein